MKKKSQALLYCVKTYTNLVYAEKNYILFLRKKAELVKPFATIEIRPDKTLL